MRRSSCARCHSARRDAALRSCNCCRTAVTPATLLVVVCCCRQHAPSVTAYTAWPATANTPALGSVAGHGGCMHTHAERRDLWTMAQLGPLVEQDERYTASPS